MIQNKKICKYIVQSTESVSSQRGQIIANFSVNIRPCICKKKIRYLSKRLDLQIQLFRVHTSVENVTFSGAVDDSALALINIPPSRRVALHISRNAKRAPGVFCWMHIAFVQFPNLNVYIKVLFLRTATTRILRRVEATNYDVTRVIHGTVVFPTGNVREGKKNRSFVTFHFSSNFTSTYFPDKG